MLAAIDRTRAFDRFQIVVGERSGRFVEEFWERDRGERGLWNRQDEVERVDPRRRRR